MIARSTDIRSALRARERQLGFIINPYIFSTALPTNFPVIGSTATFIDNVVNAVDPITMPASISAGDLLLCYYTSNLTPAHTTTLSAGWTSLFNNISGGSVSQHGLAWKIAVGGDTLTITKSANSPLGAITHRITGASSVNSSNATSGSATAPDFPALSPAPGLKAYLWFVFTSGNQSSTMNTAPTDFGSILNNTVTFGGPNQGQAQRNLAASSLDPGVSANSATVDAIVTVAVGP